MICSRCGAELPDHAGFCNMCGNKIRHQKVCCSNCGKILPFGANFCSHCGTVMFERYDERPGQNWQSSAQAGQAMGNGGSQAQAAYKEQGQAAQAPYGSPYREPERTTTHIPFGSPYPEPRAEIQTTNSNTGLSTLKKNSGKIYRRVFKALAVSLVLIILGSYIGRAEPVVPQPTEPAPVTAPVEVKDEYEEALKTAESYMTWLDTSKKGLFRQLTSSYGDHFSEEAAQYAVDNVDVDWNEKAVNCAQSYCDHVYLSKKGLRKQMISDYGEGFTEEEADYAIEHVETDWKENARKTAKQIKEYQKDISDDYLYERLTAADDKAFTREEADYAMAHLDD